MAAKKTHYTVMNEGRKIYEGMLSIQDTKKIHVWTPLYCQLLKEGEHLYFLAHKTDPPTGKPIEFTNIIRCTTEICPPGHMTPRPSGKDTYICIQSPERLIFVRAKREDREELIKHIRSELHLPTAAIYEVPLEHDHYESAELPTSSSSVRRNPLPIPPEEARTEHLLPPRPAPTRPLISAEQHKRKFDSEKFKEVQLDIGQHTQAIYYAFFNDKAYIVRSTKAYQVCAFHPGDQILKVNEIDVHPHTPIADIIYDTVEGTHMVTVKRAPYGTMVYVRLEPTQNIASLGIVWGKTEVHQINTDGLIAKTGSLPGPKYEHAYGYENCNWALTEINGQMVPFGSSTGKVEAMLRNAGRQLALLFQPAFFIDQLSSNERLISDCSRY